MTTVRMPIPHDFILGAAASAWQTEGWSGKKEGQDSWPDLWYKNDRHVWHNGYGPAVATDFINRFREDVQLMKLAGLTHYRTSINWSFSPIMKTSRSMKTMRRTTTSSSMNCWPTASSR